jgi:hypothetical protein
MNNSKLIQLIRESINEYINEIDEAGNIAMYEMKIAKIGEAIELREKKIAMEGIDEAYHDMIDKSKMKELSGEVKTLKKSLAKYEKQLEKLKNKGEKVTKVEDTEEKEIVDEVAIDENEGMGYEGMGYEGMGYEGMKENESDEMYYVDVIKANTMDEETAYNWLLSQGADNIDNIIDIAFPTMNESFLHMQKLAGVITEAQYKAKKKALNEDESSKYPVGTKFLKQKGNQTLVVTKIKGNDIFVEISDKENNHRTFQYSEDIIDNMLKNKEISSI